MNITVLAPGLFGPWPDRLRREIAGGLDVPGLVGLVHRAGARPRGAPAEEASDLRPVEGLLLDVLFPGRHWADGEPFAALSFAGDAGHRAEGWVMRADPVHLRADVGTAYLFGGDELGLDAPEARELAACISPLLAEEGMTLEPVTPSRWYLHLGERPQMHTTAPSLVAGREVGPYLPHGDHSGAWRRRFNEAQMLLHTAPVNAAREARGAMMVNSLWFWGASALDQMPRPDAPTTLWSTDPMARGLAVYGAVDHHPIPESGETLLASRGPCKHVLVLDGLYRAVLSRDVEAWRRAVLEAELRWFSPLLRGLDQGRIASLTLRHDLSGRAARVVVPRPSRLRRWLGNRWRRPGEFPDLLVASDGVTEEVA